MLYFNKESKPERLEEYTYYVDLRKKLGVSKSKLAERCGLSRSTIYRFEKGYKVRENTVIKIHKKLFDFKISKIVAKNIGLIPGILITNFLGKSKNMLEESK